MSGRKNFQQLHDQVVERDPNYAKNSARRRAEIERDIETYTLNEIRRSLGITQEEMASRLGITQSAVSKLLRDGATVDVIRRLVEAMGGTLEITAVIDGRRSFVNV